MPLKIIVTEVPSATNALMLFIPIQQALYMVRTELIREFQGPAYFDSLGLASQIYSKRAWSLHQVITLVISLTTIKDTCKPYGNFEEEVQGADVHAFKRITNPIENKLGDVVSRDCLPSFFVIDKPNRSKYTKTWRWRSIAEGAV